MSEKGNISDGYHTFNELYYHRFVLTKALFNLDAKNCLKSQLHNDGTMFDNYFIVGIKTELGWATYHYPIEHWRDFHCEEIERFPKWDGHTSEDAIERIDRHFINFAKKDEIIKALKPFAVHHELCDIFFFENGKCNCGFVEVKKKIEELSQ